MKRQAYAFVAAVLASLLIVPAVNIHSAPSWSAIAWGERSFFYNTDFASRVAARLLFPLGISVSPSQIIVGHEDWLYLGDQYDHTLTVDRRQPTTKDVNVGKLINEAVDAWKAHLSNRGVKDFRIMIGPNKGTIYPEHMPDWAKPRSPGVTDAFFENVGDHVYVDLRAPLLDARNQQPSDLYYKTDTHWNNLGAGIAFRFFAERMGSTSPELTWPAIDQYDLVRIDSRPGGDLANFLRLSAEFDDAEPMIRLQASPTEATQIDFDSKAIIRNGGNPLVGSPMKPLLVTSKGALNQKKVLWLRDSFGSALAPMMAMTFSDVLQIHWAEAMKPGGRFAQLVEEWMPDYVFFTVVERSSRHDYFIEFPPPTLLSSETAFTFVKTTRPGLTNHLEHDQRADEFLVTGTDPFIEYSLPEPLSDHDARYLKLSVTCKNGAPLVPVQLFWLGGRRTEFDEKHSARLLLSSNRNIIDLHTLARWKSDTPIERIRLDIDSDSVCPIFKADDPVFLSLNSSGQGIK